PERSRDDRRRGDQGRHPEPAVQRAHSLPLSCAGSVRRTEPRVGRAEAGIIRAGPESVSGRSLTPGARRSRLVLLKALGALWATPEAAPPGTPTSDLNPRPDGGLRVVERGEV